MSDREHDDAAPSAGASENVVVDPAAPSAGSSAPTLPGVDGVEEEEGAKPHVEEEEPTFDDSVLLEMSIFAEAMPVEVLEAHNVDAATSFEASLCILGQPDEPHPPLQATQLLLAALEDEEIFDPSVRDELREFVVRDVEAQLEVAKLQKFTKKDGASIALDFTPVVGQFKAIAQVISGRDMVTKQKVNRAVAALGLVPGLAQAAQAVRAGHAGYGAGQGMKKKRTAEQTRSELGELVRKYHSGHARLTGESKSVVTEVIADRVLVERLGFAKYPSRLDNHRGLDAVYAKDGILVIVDTGLCVRGCVRLVGRDEPPESFPGWTRESAQEWLRLKMERLRAASEEMAATVQVIEQHASANMKMCVINAAGQPRWLSVWVDVPHKPVEPEKPPEKKKKSWWRRN